MCRTASGDSLDQCSSIGFFFVAATSPNPEGLTRRGLCHLHWRRWLTIETKKDRHS
jgi:hypothetical protein